jgi:hypothetical protein
MKIQNIGIIFVLLLAYVKSMLSTGYDGIGQEWALSYITLNDSAGFKIPLETSRLSNDFKSIEYFVRVWVKPGGNEGLVFEAPNTVRCSIANMKIQCFVGDKSIDVDLSVKVGNQIQMGNRWMHVSLSGSVQQNITYLRVDSYLQ